MTNKKNMWQLPLRCVLFISGFLLLSVISGKALSGISNWWSFICVICNIITIGVLLIVCKKQKTTYASYIGYEKGKTKVSAVIRITVIILIVGMGGMYLAGLICYQKLPYMPIVMIEPVPIWIAVINVLILPLSTTLAEDGIYIGTLNQTKQTHKSVLLTAFFYAIQHSFMPLIPDVKFIIYRFLSFLPLTIMMCYWYRKNKNPMPLMIGHFIINLATVAQILMTSVSPALFEEMKAAM